MKNIDPWLDDNSKKETTLVAEEPTKYLDGSRDYLVFIFALICGIEIWALSSSVTGQQEPWDSDGPYYYVSLFFSGAVFGAIRSDRYSRWVIAILIGQLIALVFIGMGPLIIIGIGFLAILSMLPLAGAACTATLAKKLKNDR